MLVQATVEEVILVPVRAKDMCVCLRKYVVCGMKKHVKPDIIHFLPPSSHSSFCYLKYEMEREGLELYLT